MVLILRIARTAHLNKENPVTKLVIQDITNDDFGGWLPLWKENNLGQDKDEVTTETWMRLNDKNSAVKGMTAKIGDDIAAIMHYILHPTTGQIEPVCYMQDLFVGEKYRRQGIARKMVHALIKRGQKENWARIYWLADNNNEGAQALYKNLGVKIDFTLHVQPLK